MFGLSRRTLILIAVAAFVVLLVAGGAVYQTVFRSAPSVRVTTAGLSERTVTRVVDGFARAEPSVEVSIRSDVSGEITALYVKEGDRVAAGDPLLRLRDDDYRAAVQQQRAQVFRAEAQVAGARADSVRAGQDMRRQQRLFDRNMVPRSTLDSTQAAFDQAVARVDAARAAVDQARALLDRARDQAQRTRIEAPIDGVVTRLNVEVGERVLGTMRVEGTEILKIGGPRAMEFVVAVPEKEIRRIDLGDPAEIETESYGDRTVRGAVVEVANAARMGQGGIGSAAEPEYPVRVRVTTPHQLAARLQPVSIPGEGTDSAADADTTADAGDDQALVLRPGMSGEVRILAETVDGVLAVPQAAVTTRNLSRLDEADLRNHARLRRPPTGDPDDLRTVVFVPVEDRAVMVEVTLGLESASLAQVTSTLSASDDVIVGPKAAVASRLAPGTPINPGTRIDATEY